MKIIILLCIAFLSALTMANEKPLVQLSSEEVVLGETFTLKISFEHSGNTEPYVSFNPVNAEIVDDNSGQNSRTQVKGYFSAGKIVQKKIYNFIYVLQPVRSGYVHIREIKVDVGTKVYKHKSLRARVLSKAKKLPKYFVRAETNKEKVYLGEGVDVRYYLYFQGEISAPDIRKFPKLKNFLKRFVLPKSQVERVSLGSQVYKRMLIYKARVYGEKTGQLEFDPMHVAFQYPEVSRGRRDVFGMSMMFSTGTYKRKEIKSKRHKIEVVALPVEGMPKNFTGLVGKHDFVLTFTRNKVLVNDIAEARLEVTGEGALEKMDPPKILTSDSFEEFDPKTEIVEIGNLENKKVIDYTFLAKRSEKIASSVIELAIFNPETSKYEMKPITVPSLQIYGVGASSEVINSKNNKNEKEKVSENNSLASKNKNEYIAPLILDFKSSVLNLNYINIFVICLILLILLSGAGLTLNSFGSNDIKKLGKNFKYRNIYKFLSARCHTGETVREMVNSANVSNEAKEYLNMILDKAEKNEYNGGKLKLEFKNIYFTELEKNYSNENN